MRFNSFGTSPISRARLWAMSTLAEIENAAEALSVEQKQELFLFLAARRRAGAGHTLPPREFSREQIEGWIADDEAGMRRFQEER